MYRKLTRRNLRRGAKLRGLKTFHRDGDHATKKSKGTGAAVGSSHKQTETKIKTGTICDGDACPR